VYATKHKQYRLKYMSNTLSLVVFVDMNAQFLHQIHRLSWKAFEWNCLT